MLNLNFNTLECQRRGIAPVLITPIEYMIIGGGGGGNAGDGTNGGNGGGGGQFISSSFDITHLTSATIVIGNGGIGGPLQGNGGTNGQNSTLTYNAAPIATSTGGTGGGGATGGTPGVNAGTAANGTAWFLSTTNPLYGPQGGGGAGATTSVATDGGGTGGGNGGDPATSATANSGGGGGGSNWNAFPAGNGGSGISILRYFNPNNIFDATGGTISTVGDYTYHTFTSNGTFTFLGKRDR
jgi:hypothetical protein